MLCSKVAVSGAFGSSSGQFFLQDFRRGRFIIPGPCERSHQRIPFGYGSQMCIRDSMYGLLGRNGAGKTSIMKLILQLMPATSGETLLFGEPVKRRERSVFPVSYTHLLRILL